MPLNEGVRKLKMDCNGIKKVRESETLPILEELETWLKANIQQVLPKSAMGKAIAYALTFWEKQKRYTEDGVDNIDNNLIENSIRTSSWVEKTICLPEVTMQLKWQQ